MGWRAVRGGEQSRAADLLSVLSSQAQWMEPVPCRYWARKLEGRRRRNLDGPRVPDRGARSFP